jgi:hypothetical protein
MPPALARRWIRGEKGRPMGDDDETTTHQARSGSETRQRQHRITFRLNEAEYVQLAADIDRSGMTMGTYIRSRLIAAPTTGARRRPSVEVLALTRVLAGLNRVGGNINQIAKHIHFGDTPLGAEIRAALADFRKVASAILAALGRSRTDEVAP